MVCDIDFQLLRQFCLFIIEQIKWSNKKTENKLKK